MHGLPTNQLQACACFLANGAEGEAKDSNIDSGVK